MTSRIKTLCIDAFDAEKVAAFWCAVLGWQVIEVDDDGVRIDGPGGPSILFLRLPEGPKVVKNRLHLDVNATDRDQEAELARLLALGARPVDIGQGAIGQGGVTWHVLADPEGNEFCLLRSRVDPI